MPLSNSEFVKEIQQMVRRKHSGLLRVKMLNTPVLKISKSELPEPTETIVLAWPQR
jgi:hypothetical protein